MRYLAGIATIASTIEGKQYVLQKQLELLGVINEFSNKIAMKEGRIKITPEIVSENAKSEILKLYPDYEFISAVPKDFQESSVSGVYKVEVKLVFTTKQKGGFFHSDTFHLLEVDATGEYSIQCDTDNTVKISSKIKPI